MKNKIRVNIKCNKYLKAFSSETLRHTVDPIDTKYRSTIGNRVAPSFTDIKQINRVYCAGECFFSFF